MYLLLGNSHMERSDYDGAIQSFEHARARMRHNGGSLLVVSLVSSPNRFVAIAHRLRQISGWKFDNLDITIRQRLCESLYAAGRMKDAVECFHQITSELVGEMNLQGEHSKWVLGE